MPYALASMTIGKLRQKHPNAQRRWSTDEEERLEKLFRQGKRIKEIAIRFGRTEAAIQAKLEKLGLLDEEDE
jgi:ATP-dependent DNA helicase RecQ